MKSFKEIALVLGFVAFILTGQVRSDVADELDKAFDALPEVMQTAFNALSFGLLGELKDVAKCIEREGGPFDVCNFQTSFDPFFYIKKCANGTGLQTFIDDSLGLIPQLDVPLGIPLAVSKKRCYNGIPPLPLPLPFTLPSIPSLPTLPPISSLIPGPLGR